MAIFELTKPKTNYIPWVATLQEVLQLENGFIWLSDYGEYLNIKIVEEEKIFILFLLYKEHIKRKIRD